MSDPRVPFETVRAAIAAGQIGVPVAVRLIAQLSPDRGPIARLAAELQSAATEWLDSAIVGSHSFGGAESGQVTTLSRYDGGQSALVSAGSSASGPSLVSIQVIGNRGAMAWENGRSCVSTLPQRAAGLDPGAAPREATIPSPPWGVLLVAGDHTHQPAYAAALAADRRCRLIGLADESTVSPRRQAMNAQLAQRLAIPHFDDLDASLARDDVQIVSVCAEPERRGPIIVKAARAGKHMYLDKPLATSAAEAEAIVAAVRESGVVGHMFTLVRSRLAANARRLVESGDLGKLVAIHCDLTFAKGHGGTAQLGQPRREGANPTQFELVEAKRELNNIGVYPLALIAWLTHSAVRRVAATTGNYFFAEHQRLDVEDFGQVLLEHEDGLVTSISVGRTGWRSHPAGGINKIHLIGTESSALLDAHQPRIEVAGDGEPWSPPPPDPEDPMAMWAPLPGSPYAARPKTCWIVPADDPAAADAAYFLDCIEQGRQSDLSVETAADVTRTILAAYKSAASERPEVL